MKILDKRRFNYQLDVIEQYMDMEKPGKILDVGAGPGTFVEVAKERFWEPTAVEFNSFCVKRIELLGIECIDQPLENVDLPENSFDCVTLWAVFEHLQDPHNMLQIINAVIDETNYSLIHKIIKMLGLAMINFFVY